MLKNKSAAKFINSAARHIVTKNAKTVEASEPQAMTSADLIAYIAPLEAKYGAHFVKNNGVLKVSVNGLQVLTAQAA